MTVRTVCTFTIGDLLLGIDAHTVQQVIDQLQVAPVPLAPPQLVGLINLRGGILPLFDLHHALQIETTESAETEHQYTLIVKTGSDELRAVCVDRMGNVLEIDAADITPPPGTLDASLRRVITGAVPLEGALLLLIDFDRATQMGH